MDTVQTDGVSQSWTKAPSKMGYLLADDSHHRHSMQWHQPPISACHNRASVLTAG